MFVIDPDITDLKVREKKPFKVLFSMNNHHVATPEMILEEARSYVFFFGEGRDRISCYIGLHFLQTDRKLFYKHSDNPFPENQLSAVDDEARNFAEDMGAMLDEIDMTRMSEAEKNRWIDDQEILSGRKKEEEAAEVSAAPAAAQSGTPSVSPEDEVAPVAEPAAAQPLQPSVPVEPQTPSQPPVQPQPQAAPVPRSQPPVSPSPAVAPVEYEPVEWQPPAEKKKAGPRKAAQPSPVAATDEADRAPQRADAVLEEALKAGIVKAPKAKLTRDIRNAAGMVSRNKEALARLLASF